MMISKLITYLTFRMSLLILGFTLLYACSDKNEIADMVIWNGKIYTVDDVNPFAEAVAIKSGKILAVGTKQTIQNFVGDQTQLIDLQGKFLYPGFIEGHAHIMGIGDNLINVDLMGTKSYAELIEMIAARAAITPKGQWILGRGWHQDKWNNDPEQLFRGFPTHEQLSSAIPDHPVLLKHASGHAALANAKAMEIAGVLSDTQNPDGGEIFKGLNGSPTGIFNETAQSLINKVVPSDSDELLEKTLQLAMQSCLENGITSFHQAGSVTRHIELYEKFAREKKLDIRLYVMLDGNDDQLLDDFFRKGPQIDTSNWLTIRAIKLYSDGALGSRGAWLVDEYTDAPGIYGHNVVSLNEIEDKTRKAAQSGFQVCTHAIGDRGNREVLSIYQKVIDEQPAIADNHRFRIEHAQHIQPDDLKRFASLGVIPAMQAIHMSSDRPWAIDRLGKKRIEEGAYMWQTLLNMGVKIVNGTDAPVEPVSPLASFYASVSRKTLAGKPENGYEPAEKMSRLQALKSYTIDAAYGAFEEDIKGSIAVGKLADFTVFDQDIMEIPEAEILNTKVVLTVVNGEIKYQRKD